MDDHREPAIQEKDYEIYGADVHHYYSDCVAYAYLVPRSARFGAGSPGRAHIERRLRELSQG
jgi:hypothetical protein